MSETNSSCFSDLVERQLIFRKNSNRENTKNQKNSSTENSKASGECSGYSMEVQLGNKNYKELVQACQEITIAKKESNNDSVRVEDLSSHSLKDSSLDQVFINKKMNDDSNSSGKDQFQKV